MPVSTTRAPERAPSLYSGSSARRAAGSGRGPSAPRSRRRAPSTRVAHLVAGLRAEHAELRGALDYDELVAVAARLRVTVTRPRFTDSVLGMALGAGPYRVCVVRGDLPTALAAAVLAHELGHLLLGHHRERLPHDERRATRQREHEERQAHQFGTELLGDAYAAALAPVLPGRIGTGGRT